MTKRLPGVVRSLFQHAAGQVGAAPAALVLCLGMALPAGVLAEGDDASKPPVAKPAAEAAPSEPPPSGQKASEEKAGPYPTAEPKTADQKKRDEATGEQADDAKQPAILKRDRSLERTGKSKLDDALLKSLDPEAEKAEGVVDRLERAISGMRSAQEKIDEKNPGKSTQEVQTQVVKDLEQLIEDIKNADPQQQSQSQQRKKKKALKEEERMLEQQQQLNPGNSAKQKKDGSETGEQQKPKANPKDSSEQIQRQKTLDAERARRQQLTNDIWGHLPPASREKLLKLYSDKYLPKYEDLVRRYYEALAEKNKKRDSR